MNSDTPSINFDTPAKLMKWPSLNGQRISAKDGARPYTLIEASFSDCLRRLLSKQESQRHLYEIHTGDGTVVSAADALAMDKDQPPPEDEFGGGDIVSVEAEPSTEDDQPLD